MKNWNLKKLKRFCTAKYTIIWTKEEPKEREKILTNYISVIGLGSRMYAVLKILNIKKINSQLKIWVQTETDSLKDEAHIAEKS